jgi:hypothetical protein
VCVCAAAVDHVIIRQDSTHSLHVQHSPYIHNIRAHPYSHRHVAVAACLQADDGMIRKQEGDYTSQVCVCVRVRACVRVCVCVDICANTFLPIDFTMA